VRTLVPLAGLAFVALDDDLGGGTVPVPFDRLRPLGGADTPDPLAAPRRDRAVAGDGVQPGRRVRLPTARLRRRDGRWQDTGPVGGTVQAVDAATGRLMVALDPPWDGRMVVVPRVGARLEWEAEDPPGADLPPPVRARLRFARWLYRAGRLGS
jgi:hypothetical protein